jgi:hypothetical protein
LGGFSFSIVPATGGCLSPLKWIATFFPASLLKVAGGSLRRWYLDFAHLHQGLDRHTAIDPVGPVDWLGHVVEDIDARLTKRHLALDDGQSVLEKADRNDLALGRRLVGAGGASHPEH